MHSLTKASLIALVAATTAGFSPQKQAYWTPLNLEEAKILAYVTPCGVDHGKAGLDVQPITGCDVPAAHKPFVVVELVSTHPFPSGGLEDHEYVDVNLNTAAVLDPTQLPEVEIKSSEVFGVADIMRQAHGIDGRVIER